MDIKDVLNQYKSGEISLSDAEASLQTQLDLGFANLDIHRQKRTGFPEVIYGAGKSAAQIIKIFQALQGLPQLTLATRVTAEKAEEVLQKLPDLIYHPEASMLVRLPDESLIRKRKGSVSVICAGTSDLPVAEEAAWTAHYMGAEVNRFYDIGVAGLHRLVDRLGDLRSSSAIVAVAGMEGALPSVVGGLVSVPVFAVPTSVGYGANLQGISTLLAMLNACAPGISVVNIDNGFGGGYCAANVCAKG
jgi:NCAIR mutase (PurE)-related protein